jgi:hypothetical protein
VLHLAVQLFSWHGNAESLRPRFMQLRAEEVELRDRVSVLRTSGGGKANVGIIPLHTGRTLPVLRSLDIVDTQAELPAVLARHHDRENPGLAQIARNDRKSGGTGSSSDLSG